MSHWMPASFPTYGDYNYDSQTWFVEVQHILDTTPSIEPHTAVINLPDVAGGKLPSNANSITIILVRTQDTTPIIRAP
jgi:hypothetical protein